MFIQPKRKFEIFVVIQRRPDVMKLHQYGTLQESRQYRLHPTSSIIVTATSQVTINLTVHVFVNTASQVD
jgi:hypothetical protein